MKHPLVALLILAHIFGFWAAYKLADSNDCNNGNFIGAILIGIILAAVDGSLLLVSAIRYLF